VACWQATDKTWENSRLFGGISCRSLSLASNGGHSSKKNLGNSKKNKKQNSLDFQHEKEAALERAEKNVKKNVKNPLIVSFFSLNTFSLLDLCRFQGQNSDLPVV